MRELVKKKLRVPDVTGLLLENAAIMLMNAGFEREPEVRFAESYQRTDTVLQQDPPQATIVDSDRPIHLVVSRKSYMRFLPGIYQRGGFLDANFLREYLWIFQHVFKSFEDKLDVLDQYFRPLEAPLEFLEWLGSWTAFVSDPSWDEAKRRQLTKEAMRLYSLRGTVKGLKVFLAIFTGYEPEVIENTWPFKGFRIGVHSTIGVDSVILPPVNRAHCFVVQIPAAFKDTTDDMVIRIHDIIMSEKPAHTTYFLRFMAELVEREVRDGYFIGVRSGIGVGDEITGTEMRKVFRSMGDY